MKRSSDTRPTRKRAAQTAKNRRNIVMGVRLWSSLVVAAAGAGWSTSKWIRRACRNQLVRDGG